MKERRSFIKTVTRGTIGALVSSAITTPFLTSASTPSGRIENRISLKPLTLKGNDLGKILGVGGVPLASGWKPTSLNDAIATLQKSWDLGIRYFDTSPRYGLGLSERREGVFLTDKNEEEFIISTKVGRLLKPGATDPAKSKMWKGKLNADYVYDYSASGVRRSIEESLQRMGLTKIDIVYIHDLSPDNSDMKDNFDHYYRQAEMGAMPELQKMKEEGIIKAWGFGINRPDAALRSLKTHIPDICLLATQYSLLDHAEALESTFPALQSKNVRVVLGSPLNCGYVVGNGRWNYTGKPAPATIENKYQQLKHISDQFKVDLRTANLQFCMAHPIVTAVLTGVRTPEQIAENYASYHNPAHIPAAFWQALRTKNIIRPDSPVPKSA
jgi:D-threo-aldose 1-dehydrogenase